jgi:hypothetical protein
MERVFDYMASGDAYATSGCVPFRSHPHVSYNVASHMPLGQIPGSGATSAGMHSADFAVLLDVEGKCGQGPHWCFMTQAEIDQKVVTSTWTHGPRCNRCHTVPVYNVGDVCLSCTT